MIIKIVYEKIKSDEGFSLVIGNSLISVFSFLALFIISHNLTPDVYGEFREIILYSTLAIHFSTAGFAQTIYYFLNNENYSELKGLLIKQARILQITSIIIILFITGFSTLFLIQNSRNYHFTDYSAVIIYVIFASFSVVDINIAILCKRYLKYFKYNVLVHSLRCVSFLIISIFSNNLTFLLSANAFFQILITVVNRSILRENYLGTKEWKINIPIQKKMFNYTAPLFMTGIMGYLIMNTGKFVVSIKDADIVNFSIFANVTFEVPFLANVYISYFTIAMPAMMIAYQTKNMENLLEIRRKYTVKVAQIIIPLSLAVIVWHEHLIRLFFGNTYAEYSYLFAIYSTIGILRVCSHHDILLITDKTKDVFYFQVIEFLFHIVLSFALYNRYGLLGLVIATVITNYLYITVINIYSARVLKAKVSMLFPYLFILKEGFLFGVSAIVFRVVFDRLIPQYSFYFSTLLWAVFVVIIKRKELKKYLKKAI